MLEYFLERGRMEDWTIPPSGGELVFRVNKTHSPRLKTNDRTIYPKELENVWDLMVVSGLDTYETSIIFKGLLSSGLGKDGSFLVRPFDKEINEYRDFFKIINNNEGDDINRPRYFRANELEVCQFFVVARISLNLIEEKGERDPFCAFNEFCNKVLDDNFCNYLPVARKTVERACNWAKRIGCV